MAKKKSLLERMKLAPHQDWSIEKVKTVCKQNGVSIDKPSGGSHYKVYSEKLDGILTVPRARPIKTVYIENLVGLIEAHVEASKPKKG